ncbi:unnamed protein product [Leuciscus chuanchicus]
MLAELSPANDENTERGHGRGEPECGVCNPSLHLGHSPLSTKLTDQSNAIALFRLRFHGYVFIHFFRMRLQLGKSHSTPTSPFRDIGYKAMPSLCRSTPGHQEFTPNIMAGRNTTMTHPPRDASIYGWCGAFPDRPGNPF